MARSRGAHMRGLACNAGSWRWPSLGVGNAGVMVPWLRCAFIRQQLIRSRAPTVLLLAAAAALLAAAAASPPPPLSAPAPSRPFPQVLEVVEVIASLKGVDVAQVAEATYQNTLRVLFDSGS